MVIVITGTSAGIGRELAEHFGRLGHHVYGLSRTHTESEFFTSLAADITQENAITTAVQEILEKENRIDVLINNAGRGMVGPTEDASAQEISQLFALNVIAASRMCSAVLPVMRAQNSGRIINVSSIGSEMGLPFRGFYSASKAALDKITEAMRYEVAAWNIQVTAVHLGDIKTGIAENRLKTSVSGPYKTTFEKVYALMNSHVDAGSEPQEVAVYFSELLLKKTWKPHYYFGKFGQKIGVPLKWMLPQLLYENLMKKYNKMNQP